MERKYPLFVQTLQNVKPFYCEKILTKISSIQPLLVHSSIAPFYSVESKQSIHVAALLHYAMNFHETV